MTLTTWLVMPKFSRSKLNKFALETWQSSWMTSTRMRPPSTSVLSFTLTTSMLQLQWKSMLSVLSSCATLLAQSLLKSIAAGTKPNNSIGSRPLLNWDNWNQANWLSVTLLTTMLTLSRQWLKSLTTASALRLRQITMISKRKQWTLLMLRSSICFSTRAVPVATGPHGWSPLLDSPTTVCAVLTCACSLEIARVIGCFRVNPDI